MIYSHPTAIVSVGAELGEDVTIWAYARVGTAAKIGDGVVIGHNVYIDDFVEIGRGTRIQTGAQIYHRAKIGEYVFIGPGAILTNNKEPWIDIDPVHEGVTVESRASIGAGAVILAGIHIGVEAMIGAGSVVTRNVPDGALAYGNPARLHGKSPRRPRALQGGLK